MKRKALGLLPCGVALALVSSIAMGQAVKLRVADSFPSGHWASEKVTKVWIAKINERAGKAVNLEYYPADQLGTVKNMLSLTGSGVVDIGYVGPAFVGDKLPLSVVAELPGEFKSSCLATQAFYKLATGDGILAKQEFAPNNVRVLWAYVLVPFQVMLGGKVNFDDLKSLQGLKIRTAGGAKEIVIRKLGAVPVQTASNEIYEAITRGTVDGALNPYTSVYPYGLERAFRSSTINENFGSHTVTYVMNERKWKSLPPEVQKVITEESEKMLKTACSVVNAEDAEGVRKLKAGGLKIVEFAAADKTDLRNRLSSVSREWAEALDKRGKPGSQVLKTYQQELSRQEELAKQNK